jgi:hypothetical protein
MLYNILLTIALAATANAKTPDGFEPASSQDLFVAFGTTPAIDGVNLPKACQCPSSFFIDPTNIDQ